VGYGEYGGGGSLRWRVLHERITIGGEITAPGGKTRASYTDPDATEGEPIYVVINGGARVVENTAGRLIIEVPLTKDRDDIQIYWAADVPEEVRRLSGGVRAPLPAPADDPVQAA
jgi:hypothetical protein